MIIYKITNTVNGKCYIGQTRVPLNLRWAQHCQVNRKRSCPGIRNAIKKYGASAFSIDVIEHCSDEDANAREEHWIQIHGAFGDGGYNLNSGGNRRDLSPESRAKIGDALRGRKISGRVYRPGYVPWNKNRPWSEEMKSKLSAAHKKSAPWLKGRKLSDAHKLKMSTAKKGKAAPALYKPVLCITNGVRYESGRHAAKALGIQTSKISLVLHGKRNHTGGHRFEFSTSVV